VDALVEKLDARLARMEAGDGRPGAERVTEVIDLAGHDVLDLLRFAATEQEVLDLLD